MNAQTLNNVIKAKILQDTQKFADRADAQAFMDDAGIDQATMIANLSTIFVARHDIGIVELQEFDEYAGMSIEDAQHKFMLECVTDDNSLEDLIEDAVRSALTWYCLEDWASYYEYIVANVTAMDLDVYKKAVNFLYDGYAVEEAA